MLNLESQSTLVHSYMPTYYTSAQAQKKLENVVRTVENSNNISKEQDNIFFSNYTKKNYSNSNCCFPLLQLTPYQRVNTLFHLYLIS